MDLGSVDPHRETKALGLLAVSTELPLSNMRSLLPLGLGLEKGRPHSWLFTWVPGKARECNHHHCSQGTVCL